MKNETKSEMNEETLKLICYISELKLYSFCNACRKVFKNICNKDASKKKQYKKYTDVIEIQRIINDYCEQIMGQLIV